MINISGCAPTAISAVTSRGVNLQAAGEPTVIGTVSALKLSNTAAVGGAVGTPLKVAKEEECLFACLNYVQNCQTVTVANVGWIQQCNFHSSDATQGIAATGSTTYNSITTTRGTPALGRLAPARAAVTVPEVPAAGPADGPVGGPMPEMLAPAPEPMAPEPQAITPGPDAIDPPAPAPVPDLAAPPVITEPPMDAEQPEDAAVPLTPAPAPAPEENAAAGMTLEELIFTDVADCGPVMSEIPTGKHLPTLAAPEEAISYYGDLLKDGEFPMSYGEVARGGTYCIAPGSTAPKVVFGGMMFWSNDGQCHLPPTKQDGSSCCEIFMWQPNAEGYYYDNCSMKMTIEADGMWWFTTEMPGDESVVGWGPDPAPHIHYDVRCSGCEGTDAFPGTKYQYWSKFYAREICTLEPCGNVNKEEHMSEELTGPEGETLFRYNFVLPAESKGKL